MLSRCLIYSLCALQALSTPLNLFIVSHCFQMVLCVQTQHFTVVLFGSISNQLAAVGSTMQPNCSFRILCLFSDCQNTRMRNQGWVLDEARQISQHCRPSLLCGRWSDATEVYFLHFVWSLKMEESVTLNWRRYASDDSVSALIITHYLLSVNLICVRADSILFDLSRVGLSWVETYYFILSGPFLTTTAHQC